MAQTVLQKVEDALNKLANAREEFLDQATELNELEGDLRQELAAVQTANAALESKNQELLTQLQAQATEIEQLKTASIGTDRIVDGAITLAKINGNAIDGSKIQDGSIGTAELANGAVNNAKIANGSVSESKLDNATKGKINRAVPRDNSGFVALSGSGHGIGNGWERILEVSDRSRVILFRGENVNYAIGVNNNDQLKFFAFKEGDPKNTAITINSDGTVDTS